jgi:hypothetical protein
LRYSGTSGPNGVVIAAGKTFTWFSDGVETRSGFVICASHMPPPQLPLPPSPPLPPSSPQIVTTTTVTASSSADAGGVGIELSAHALPSDGFFGSLAADAVGAAPSGVNENAHADQDEWGYV